MKKKIIALIILIAFTLVGCNKETVRLSAMVSDKVEKSELTVAAASDLTQAFQEVGIAFEKAYDCKIIFSFGSTGTLAEQIANGAPFDVFAAANEEVIQELDEKGYVISETSQLYALGRIGIASLRDTAIEMQTLEDLLKPEIKKIAIANPDHAPYGLAAKQALQTAGLWEALEPKLVYGKNISETLTFVTTGNAEAGLIALSLNDEETLKFTLIDEKLHKPLRQAVAVIKNTKEEELGRKFIAYMRSEEGRKLMSQYGFASPEE